MLSPLSLSTNCTLLNIIDASLIKSRWKRELNIEWQLPDEVDKIYYWRDESTGLHFYSPAEAAGGADLYEQLQEFSWYYMQEKWEFSAALRLLESSSKVKKVLEIGAGEGAFLQKACKNGLLAVGLELNHSAAAAARKKGLKIIQKQLSDLELEQNSQWDAICAFQVLEHLPQPRLFLEQAIYLLKPGGLLILSVPNAAVARKLDPERSDLLDQPPHHMSHWDEGVFRSLETSLQLKVHHLLFEPLAPYHINWFIEAWKQRHKRKHGSIVNRVIYNKYTVRLLAKALNTKLRLLVRGHTLLACLKKI